MEQYILAHPHHHLIFLHTFIIKYYKYYTVGTVPKSNRKIAKVKSITPKAKIYDKFYLPQHVRVPVDSDFARLLWFIFTFVLLLVFGVRIVLLYKYLFSLGY